MKQVFTSSKPTQTTPGVVGGASTSSSTPWGLIAGVAVGAMLLALVVALAVFQLLRRRGGAGKPAGAQAEGASPAQFIAPGCMHDWGADYDNGHLAADGIWRFPHRCRTCGVQVLATDDAAATAQAEARRAAG